MDGSMLCCAWVRILLVEVLISLIINAFGNVAGQNYIITSDSE